MRNNHFCCDIARTQIKRRGFIVIAATQNKYAIDGTPLNGLQATSVIVNERAEKLKSVCTPTNNYNINFEQLEQCRCGSLTHATGSYLHPNKFIIKKGNETHWHAIPFCLWHFFDYKFSKMKYANCIETINSTEKSISTQSNVCQILPN